jgi:hypothetical protein
MSWHLDIFSLLYFSSNMFVKAVVQIKNNSADVTTMTAGTTTTPFTQLTKQCVIFRQFESETIYQIIDIYIVTHVSLLKHLKVIIIKLTMFVPS